MRKLHSIFVFLSLILFTGTILQGFTEYGRIEQSHLFESEGGARVNITASISDKELGHRDSCSIHIMFNLTALNPDAEDIHDIELEIKIGNIVSADEDIKTESTLYPETMTELGIQYTSYEFEYQYSWDRISLYISVYWRENVKWDLTDPKYDIDNVYFFSFPIERVTNTPFPSILITVISIVAISFISKKKLIFKNQCLKN